MPASALVNRSGQGQRVPQLAYEKASKTSFLKGLAMEEELLNALDEVEKLRDQIEAAKLRYTSVRPEGDTARRYWVRGISTKQGVPSVSIHRLSEIPKFWNVEFAGPIPEPEN